VAQLYPQAPGSVFVAYYDSQGYSGGIRTRLHMGGTVAGTDCIENTSSNSSSVVACVSVTMEACLLGRSVTEAVSSGSAILLLSEHVTIL
jgi:hypothetical protein